MNVDRRAFLGLAALIAPLLRAARAFADEPAGPGALIARAQSRVKTLQGPFTQERTIGLMKTVIRSRGTVLLARPDRLRWELAPPDDVVYWVTPEGFAYRSAQGAGHLPATNARLTASLDDVRALLGDVSRLRARYELTERARDGGGAVLECTPRDPAAWAFKRISLELGPDLVRPVRATLLEGPRDKTEIIFGELRVDSAIDPRLLAPPA
jgi:hypothetical protein